MDFMSSCCHSLSSSCIGRAPQFSTIDIFGRHLGNDSDQWSAHAVSESASTHFWALATELCLHYALKWNFHWFPFYIHWRIWFVSYHSEGTLMGPTWRPKVRDYKYVKLQHFWRHLQPVLHDLVVVLLMNFYDCGTIWWASINGRLLLYNSG